MRWFGSFLVLLLGSMSVGQAAPAKWYADYEVAQAEARRTGKPIFLVFRCVP